MSEKFASPDALQEFALETAAQLSAAGLTKAGAEMEAAANFSTSSGWEWLGEVATAAASIRKRSQISDAIAARLARLQAAATSQQPYG